MDTTVFDIGAHRPVYLWAGPGTIRMNRLKFMNAPVDEAVHHEAHTAIGAARMAQEAGFSWAYLMVDWGFPPEVAREDFADFAEALRHYHAAGIKVFGYVQTSNCVVDGSFADKTWYARDPQGRPIYYYTGRYMTCWRHPEWQAHLREVIAGIVEAGADGVFFDNPWYGAQPLHAGGVWLGGVGCYCERCQTSFWETAQHQIPPVIDPEHDALSRQYVQWRAAQATRILGQFADYARELNPNLVISANDFDAVMRPSYLIYGIDIAALAEVQDVLMIEDYGLPRWEPDKGLLINNALTLRVARALARETPVSVNPYDKGIGFDDVYSARRYAQAIAEAAACGASTVIKGTEYVDQETGAFTLLTAERYAEQRAVIGEMHRWLAAQAERYRDRRNVAPVALLHPGDALWQQWDAIAPRYFGAGQTLLAAGIPWRVVTPEDDWDDVQVLLRFGPLQAGGAVPAAFDVIDVAALPGWESPRPGWLARHPKARGAATGLADRLYRAYFQYRWARRLGDRLGMVHFFVQSPYFHLPGEAARAALLDALGPRPYPRVISDAPMLIELWRRAGRLQLHLVNYAPETQDIKVEFAQPVTGEALSPGSGSVQFIGVELERRVDVYAVLEYGAKRD